MANNIRDLAEWYPFIPPAGDLTERQLEFIRNILDIHIVIEVPATDILYDMAVNGRSPIDRIQLGYGNTLWCYGEIFTAIESHGYNYMQIHPSVIIGRDSELPYYTSYILQEKSLEYPGAQGGAGYDIQLRCCDIIQQAPELYMRERTLVQMDEAQAVVQRKELVTSFRNNHNVDLSFENNILRWNGAPGAGTGLWETQPYVDAPSNYSTQEHPYKEEGYPQLPAAGLRSINGERDIIFSGGPSIDVAVSTEDSASNEGKDIVVTLIPKVQNEQ